MDWFTLSEIEWQALLLSVKVSGLATLLALPPGVFFAWLLAKKDFIGKDLLDGFLHMPMVLPPVVVGYVLLVVFGAKGILGEPLYQYFGIRFAFDWKGAALAAMVVSFPLLVANLRVSIAAVDEELIEVARTLGKGSFSIFFKVILPISKPGLYGGTILAFARALGEFGATITLAANIPGRTQTLPLALYTEAQTPGGELAAMRLCAISILLAIAAMMLAGRLRKKGVTS